MSIDKSTVKSSPTSNNVISNVDGIERPNQIYFSLSPQTVYRYNVLPNATVYCLHAKFQNFAPSYFKLCRGSLCLKLLSYAKKTKAIC